MTNDTTTDYYNSNACDFIDGTVNVDTGSLRERFLKYVPTGGSVLDLGCGSGRDSKCFKDAGYKVIDIDASQELCIKASKYAGIDVQCMRLFCPDFVIMFLYGILYLDFGCTCG